MINTYTALVGALTAAIDNSDISNIDLTDVAYENMPFEPEGKNAWLSVYYIPATIDSLAKDRFDEETGIFQISAYVPLNDKTGNVQRGVLRLTQICQDLINVYYKNSVVTAGGISVTISDSTMTPAITSESWIERAISINYLRN